MVTQNGNHTVRVVVVVQFFLQCANLRRAIVELVLERDRSIVSTEHFCTEALHVRLQMLVKVARLVNR